MKNFIFGYLRLAKNLVLAGWGVIHALLATVSVIIYLMIWENDGKKRFPFGHLSQFWGRWIAFGLGLRVEVTGLENINSSRKYIFVANHESNADVIALMKVLPIGLVTMTKKGMRKIPILGYGLYRSGVIFVDRSDGGVSARKKIVKDMVRMIQSTDLSLYLFPEGSRGDKAREFKTGAFRTAIEAGLPIVPISLVNTDKVWPIGACINLKRHHVIKVIIGKPVSTAIFCGDASDKEKLKAMSHYVQGEIFKNIE